MTNSMPTSTNGLSLMWSAARNDMRLLLRGLAIVFEVAAAICADLGEDEDDRDEREQRSELNRLWQKCQPPPAAP